MTALVLLGLMIVSAKLLSDVAALRERLAFVENGFGHIDAPHWTDMVAEVAPLHRAPAAEPDDITAEDPKPDRVALRQANSPIQTDATPEPPTEMTVPEEVKPVHLDLVETRQRRFGFEDLFGRKLPIWAGGVTLAVAGFLIVKYSIDAGLLSPAVRVVLGLIFGAALIAGGEAALRWEAAVRDPRVRQALAGAGIATLYASVLVAANLYHLVGPATAFVGMALTTLLAGGLSLRFGAPSALLGLVGGLAAPALVGSGAADVPLLSAYLTLAVGGLCALSRRQRWWWLGVSALIGGFGWSALLIAGGALDAAASLSIGMLTLAIGVVLPMLGFSGRRNWVTRAAASLAACVQLAALVATGGFAPLDWALFGLVSTAIVWLSRREASLADLPAAGLTIALLLAAAWSLPPSGSLALVIAGIAAVYGAPAAWRVWRDDARVADAGQIAAIALAVLLLPAWHLPLLHPEAALLAMLGATVAGTIAAVGWTCATRHMDARFAILATVVATLFATAAVIVVPVWLAAPAIAIAAAGLLLLARRAGDARVEASAWGMGAVALAAAAVTSGDNLQLALGIGHGGGAATGAIRWLVPAAVAVLFARRSRCFNGAAVAQPIAVMLGYVAAAQIVPVGCLPVVPAGMLATLALGRRTTPALVAAAILTAGWAVVPLGSWFAAGGGALVGVPMFVTALPGVAEMVSRLLLPALAAGVVALRRSEPRLHEAAIVAAAALGTVSLHIAYKQLFAIGDAAAFVRLGVAERTVWEMLLTGLAVAVSRRWPSIAKAFAAASLAHFLLFTALLHDPLWAMQAVGPWPVVNMLLPAFGTALALTWWAGSFDLSQLALRLRGWAQMFLILLFAAATLRQLVHGSVLVVGRVGAGEDIARSVLLIGVAIGFLRHGIVAPAREERRDWRIASLGLMLVAVAKVFLSDAAGLDGLARIGSFAALGFSLIGIGWLYSRYLPDGAGLTPASPLPDTLPREN